MNPKGKRRLGSTPAKHVTCALSQLGLASPRQGESVEFNPLSAHGPLTSSQHNGVTDLPLADMVCESASVDFRLSRGQDGSITRTDYEPAVIVNGYF